MFLCILLLQIPEEEKNLGPHDRLIHVYHFTKDTTQNQMVYRFNWFSLLYTGGFDTLIARINFCNLVLHFMYSKFRTLGNLFSWSYTNVRLWLKLDCEYRRSFKFQTMSLSRYFSNFASSMGILGFFCYNLFWF